MKRLLAAAVFLALSGPVRAELPAGIARQLPAGFHVLASASVADGAYYVVALARGGEPTRPWGAPRAPARPLLVFARQPGGAFLRAGRNDTVVLRATDGGQCDPFGDGGGVIAVTGRYFTVENGVACGQHWTDFITFRLDPARRRFVFDNERVESWVLNPSQAPDAPALVRDVPARLRRGDPARPVAFSDWRPSP